MEAPVTETSYHDDDLTRLLFSLPGELRNVIYDLCLPPAESHIETGSAHPEWSWMACSRQLFDEAATLRYSGGRLYHSLTLTLSSSEMYSLVSAFRDHIRSTYVSQEQAWGWIESAAGSMIRDVVLDIRMNYGKLPDLSAWLIRLFRGWQDIFTGAKNVFLLLTPHFMPSDPGVLKYCVKAWRGWVDLTRPRWGHHLRRAAITMSGLCPEGCESEWGVSDSAYDTYQKAVVMKKLRPRRGGRATTRVSSAD